MSSESSSHSTNSSEVENQKVEQKSEPKGTPRKEEVRKSKRDEDHHHHEHRDDSRRSSRKEEDVRRSKRDDDPRKSRKEEDENRRSSKKEEEHHHEHKEDTKPSKKEEIKKEKSSSTSSSSEEDEKIAKRQSKIKTIPIEGEEKKVEEQVKLRTATPKTPFVDIPESVSIKPLDTEITEFEGMKQEDFERLKKYNESYEDGRNLLHYFINNINMYEGVAYYQEKAKQPSISFKKFYNEIKIASRSYIELNVPKRAVLFLTKNTWQAYALGLGCVLAGMIQVYVNPNLPLNDLVECIKQSGVFQIVTDMDHKDVAADLITLTKVQGLLIDGVTHDDDFITYETFKNLGQRMNDTIIQKRMQTIQPTEIAEIVFIQGKKGIHGVVWTHGNIISQMNSMKNAFQLDKNQRIIMSHHMSFYLERIFTLYLPLMFGYMTYIPNESIHHEGLKHFIETARNIKPTIVYGVPRFYEKLLERAKEATKDSKAVKKAKYLGVQGYINQESGVSKPPGFGQSRAKVFNPMKEKLGLKETKYFICTDMLPRELYEEILGKGIELFTGLSLPETTGFCFVNRERNLQIESVGRPLKGVSIVFEGKNNLWVSGSSIAGGYTDGSFGPHGFNTQMKAKLMKYKDSNIAFVKIVSKNNEFIRTSNGEQITMTRIEEAMKQISVIKKVLVVGENRPFLSCIMSVDFAEAKRRLKEKCPSEKELVKDVYFGSYIRQRIDRLNKMLPHPVQVKRFALVLEGSEESNWLKDSMTEDERNASIEHFTKVIDALYKRGGKEVVHKDKKEEEAIQKQRRQEEKERLKEEKEQRKLNKK